MRALTNFGVGKIPLKVIYCLNFVGVEFFIKTSSIKLQSLVQMTSVEPINELHEWVARYVDERLGHILWEVNQLDVLFNNEIIEQTLLGEQLLALRTQGGSAQGASIQRIILM